MEIIIVFSNPDRAVKNDWVSIPSETNPIFRTPIGIDGQRELWIVFDVVANLTDFITSKITDSVRWVNILYHTNPDHTLIEDLKAALKGKGINSSAKKSKHSDAFTYKKVSSFERHQNNEAKSIEFFDALKKRIGIDENLEKKLELLHFCLSHEEIPKVAPDWLTGISLEKFELLKVLHSESPFKEENYINTLRELREALLSNY